MASPGYGKHTAPGELPRRQADFAHLPPREASIAHYIDRAPDGADISVKSLARVLPYGQCALRTALRNLAEAGHLRRVKEHVRGADGAWNWVTHTYFTRTAREDGWWAAFRADDVAPAEAPPVAVAGNEEVAGEAYAVLAGLGRVDRRMTLSAAECAALAPLVVPWLERGAGREEVRDALTAGLPAKVHHPAGLVRVRLRDKVPPVRLADPESGRPEARRLESGRPALRILECVVCRAPGRPEALPGGRCRPCRGEGSGEAPPRVDVARLTAGVRRAREAARPRHR
ncbi:hypothetical protein GL263_10395 [Streptomyces durbertensis]|uniref:MarR family transcriptional regulator n=1 Tax=Streptomyces durbertensis TaxID=2448886 RepID=A0ABR6EFV3_9ACTN|nr:hypothetical protein [Streptomyces durbertensis]MBB1243962.1 hypothetical protein [Streptomyces durbertensis]